MTCVTAAKNYRPRNVVQYLAGRSDLAPYEPIPDDVRRNIDALPASKGKSS